MPLEYLDLSSNQLQGTVPYSWTSGSTLATNLQAFMMQQNPQLTGTLPYMNMPALSCWSMFGNWQLCGPVPSSGVCGNLNSTWLGENIFCWTGSSVSDGL